MTEDMNYPKVVMTMSEEEVKRHLKKYGKMFLEYFKEMNPYTFTVYLMMEELLPLCKKREQEAVEYEYRMEREIYQTLKPDTTDDMMKIIQMKERAAQMAREMTIEDIIQRPM